MSAVQLGAVGEYVDAGGIRTNVLQAGDGAPVRELVNDELAELRYQDYSSGSSDDRSGRGRP